MKQSRTHYWHWFRYSTWFFIAQIAFIILIIYRESYFIAQLYKLQKAEQQHHAVSLELQELTHEINEITSIASAHIYAAQHPNLKPIHISAVHTIYDTSLT